MLTFNWGQYKENIPVYPSDIGLFCTVRELTGTDHLPDPIQKY